MELKSSFAQADFLTPKVSHSFGDCGTRSSGLTPQDELRHPRRPPQNCGGYPKLFGLLTKIGNSLNNFLIPF